MKYLLVENNKNKENSHDIVSLDYLFEYNTILGQMMKNGIRYVHFVSGGGDLKVMDLKFYMDNTEKINLSKGEDYHV